MGVWPHKGNLGRATLQFIEIPVFPSIYLIFVNVPGVLEKCIPVKCIKVNIKMGEERTALPYRRTATNTCRRNAGDRKPLLKHQSHNCWSKTRPWRVKLVGENLRRNRILAQSQSMSFKIFINYIGKNNNFTAGNPADPIPFYLSYQG